MNIFDFEPTTMLNESGLLYDTCLTPYMPLIEEVENFEMKNDEGDAEVSSIMADVAGASESRHVEGEQMQEDSFDWLRDTRETSRAVDLTRPSEPVGAMSPASLEFHVRTPPVWNMSPAELLQLADDLQMTASSLLSIATDFPFAQAAGPVTDLSTYHEELTINSTAHLTTSD